MSRAYELPDWLLYAIFGLPLLVMIVVPVFLQRNHGREPFEAAPLPAIPELSAGHTPPTRWFYRVGGRGLGRHRRPLVTVTLRPTRIDV